MDIPTFIKFKSIKITQIYKCACLLYLMEHNRKTQFDKCS